jgi:hypothetical protein
MAIRNWRVAQVSKPAVSPDFQVGRTCGNRAGSGFGNPRYSRLGSLRYKRGLTGYGPGASFPRNQDGGKGQDIQALSFPGKRHQMTK